MIAHLAFIVQLCEYLVNLVDFVFGKDVVEHILLAEVAKIVGVRHYILLCGNFTKLALLRFNYLVFERNLLNVLVG